MILKDTILSTVADRITLLRWLKQVEKALRDSTLTDILIDQISETQVKFKFTFANGDFVESPILTLPRGVKGDKGDKGDTGATGATGATPNISVTATELPAGSPPTATRSGTDENPIITFGIPSGSRMQLYLHNFSYLTNEYEIYFSMYLSTSDSISSDSLYELLKNDFNTHNYILGTVLTVATNRSHLMYAIRAELPSDTKRELTFSYINEAGDTSVITIDSDNPPSNGDNVTPLSEVIA